MKAGPMNGSSARMPRRSPANAWRASTSVRPATVSIANEHLPGKAEGDLPEPAAEANRDRTFVAAGLDHLDLRAELEPEVADRPQLVGIAVRDAADRDPVTRRAGGERGVGGLLE